MNRYVKATKKYIVLFQFMIQLKYRLLENIRAYTILFPVVVRIISVLYFVVLDIQRENH